MSNRTSKSIELKGLIGQIFLIGVTCLLFAPGICHGQELKKVILGITAQGNDVSMAVNTVAKAVGFFKEEGLDVEIQPCAGSNDAAKQLGAGRIQFSIHDLAPTIKGWEPEIGMHLVSVYTVYTYNVVKVGVLKDSPIKKVTDLKGKTVGCVNFGSVTYSLGKLLIKSGGIDPDKDISWVDVGSGAQAAAALRSGRIDAISTSDTQFAAFNNLELQTRLLDIPIAEKLCGNSLTVTESYFKDPDNKAAIIGVGRALAKATVFSLANPEAAVKIHWKLVPTTAPTGNKDEALRKDLNMFGTRLFGSMKKKYPTWGWVSKEEWETYRDFMFAQASIKTKQDINKMFSDQYNKEMNDFDEAYIKKMAKDYKDY